MSWMSHLVPLHEVVAIVHLDLKQIVESILVLLVVSTTDEVELALRSIDALEVVGELILVLHLHLSASGVQEVHLEDHPGVLLQEVHHVACWTVVL